jgi:RNA polymerase sigma-70 factor (ECF subfamily)
MAACDETVTDKEVAELIAGCARRDRPAFQRLYERTAPRLLGCLIRILRDRALAEDALQDVFVQVWNRAGQFEAGRGSAWGWLLDDIPADDDSLDPSAFGLGERTARMLSHCLGALQPRQRDCIVLAFQGGLTHAEVSAQVGEPLGSVKSWIRRGLAALKECLES